MDNQNQGTMIDRVNNLVSQLLSKAELAFSLSQILSEELLKAIPDFINYHYQLIQTCLVGYRYKVLLNAQGFCFNEIALICEELRNMAKPQKDLKMMLTEYQADKTDVTIQIKENIREQVEKQKIIYTLAEIKVNELTQSNQYLKFNISNFMKLLSIYENTEYKIYIRWFRFFWKHSLRQQLNYIKSKPYDIGYLRLLATIEKFLMVDSDFPTSIDRYYNPLNIIIEETITKEELEAIIEQRKNV